MTLTFRAVTTKQISGVARCLLRGHIGLGTVIQRSVLRSRSHAEYDEHNCVHYCAIATDRHTSHRGQFTFAIAYCRICFKPKQHGTYITTIGNSGADDGQSR